MSRLTGIRAARYRREKVGELGAVLAPPYDVISPADAENLRQRHPYNIVRLTNPEGEGATRYDEAARTLRSWFADGVLFREERPTMYIHRHTFPIGGAQSRRTGLWAALRLSTFDEGVILPHEETMGGPKADRLALMRACRAQLSPIFFICSDPGGDFGEALRRRAAREAPLSAEFPADQTHEIWPVDENAVLEELDGWVRERTFLIADGHHRYETALAYRDELVALGLPVTGSGAHEFVLAYIVPEGDPGLKLFPTHRVIRGEGRDWRSAVSAVRRRFAVEELAESELGSAISRLEQEAGGAGFILVARDMRGGWRLRLREETSGSPAMAAPALHEVFLGEGLGLPREEQVQRIDYVREAGDALDLVRGGSMEAAFFLAPARVEQVRESAAAGRRLPPKTTYFWPKVPTGIAIHTLHWEE